MSLIVMDSRKRVSLTKVIGDSKVAFFDASMNKAGEITLKPLATIPAHEAWLYKNPTALETVKKGLASKERVYLGSFAKYAKE